jgi:transcriptional regulator with XRE-family HTH domain
MEIHEIIKTLRIKNGLSQEELASLVGYSDRSSIAKVESGQVDLTQSKIRAFSKALNVSPAYLMGISDTQVAPTVQCETPDECDLVRNYRQLNPSGKEYIRQTISITLQAYSEKNDAVSELETAQ